MLDLLFIIGAKYLIVPPLLIAGGYVLLAPKEERKRIFTLGIVSSPIVLFVAFALNHVYDDPRPFIVGHFIPLIPHNPDNGFPSDHVLLASAVAALITVFHRWLGAVLWVIAVFVAISRVYVGVHHPVDVIASILISISVLTVVNSLLTGKGRS